MKGTPMKHSTLITATVASIFFGAAPLSSVAQVPATSQPAPATTAATATRNDMVMAEVRKVDKDGGKVTLKHGPIKNLDMPAMTMVFRVKDPALFEVLTEGASVNAVFEKSAGNYYVTKVEPIKK
jgi:Cu(I)/Ag(I) efflux system periplasmic protein CusF